MKRNITAITKTINKLFYGEVRMLNILENRTNIYPYHFLQKRTVRRLPKSCFKMWLVIILFLIGVATFLYYYLTKDFGQFKKYGIPEHDGSFPFGSKETLEMFTGQRPITRGAEPIYLKYKQHKVVGYHSLGNMTLVVNDLDLVKQMFIKDFDHFVDRRKVNLGTGPLAKYFDNNLLNLDGDQWKEMRSTVSPAFTSGKLRVMCKLIDKVSHTAFTV